MASGSWLWTGQKYEKNRSIFAECTNPIVNTRILGLREVPSRVTHWHRLNWNSQIIKASDKSYSSLSKRYHLIVITAIYIYLNTKRDDAWERGHFDARGRFEVGWRLLGGHREARRRLREGALEGTRWGPLVFLGPFEKCGVSALPLCAGNLWCRVGSVPSVLHQQQVSVDQRNMLCLGSSLKTAYHQQIGQYSSSQPDYLWPDSLVGSKRNSPFGHNKRCIYTVQWIDGHHISLIDVGFYWFHSSFLRYLLALTNQNNNTAGLKM